MLQASTIINPQKDIYEMEKFLTETVITSNKNILS